MSFVPPKEPPTIEPTIERCPNPSADALEIGLTGHRYRLERSTLDREVWKCVRCGQVKIESSPFMKQRKDKKK